MFKLSVNENVMNTRVDTIRTTHCMRNNRLLRRGRRVSRLPTLLPPPPSPLPQVCASNMNIDLHHNISIAAMPAIANKTNPGA